MVRGSESEHSSQKFPRGTRELLKMQVQEIIGKRLEMDLLEPPKGKYREVGELESEVARSFCEDTRWWIEVGEFRFTPANLVKSLVVRKDGEPKVQKQFSVFVADSKRFIGKWGIRPLLARNKEKRQLWDDRFVRAFLSRLESGRETLAYTLEEDYNYFEMLELFDGEMVAIIGQYDLEGMKHYFKW